MDSGKSEAPVSNDWVYSRAKAIRKGQGNANDGYCKAPLEDRNEEWVKNVKCKEDAEKFFMKHYPEMPTEVCRAYAHYIDRAVRGEIELPPQFLQSIGAPK